MVKKNATKKKAMHNNSEDVAKKTTNETPLIEMNQSTILTGVIFLLVGLIVGALIVSATGLGSPATDDSTCNVDLPVNESAIKEKITNYLNSNLRQAEMISQGLSFSLEDANDLSSTTKGYEVYVGDGSGVTQPAGAIIYVDGDNFVIAQSYPINVNETPSTQDGTDTTTQTLQKSDKPELEVFVSPYCPYGLQYMKGLIPVYSELKDKADIKIQLLSPTHIQEEEPEIIRELCIQDLYSNDQYFEYLRNVVYDADAAECYNVYHGINLQTGESIPASENTKNGEYFVNCLADIQAKAMVAAGIDSSAVDTCVTERGAGLYETQLSYNSKYAVSGSPTPFINGTKLSGVLAGRSPEAIKEALCSAFNIAPDECDTVLSTDTYTPGMGLGVAEQAVTNSLCG